MRRLRLAGVLLGVAALATIVAASVWTSPALADLTQACTTPGACPFDVPDNVTSVTIEVWGAAGGSGGAAGASCTPVTGEQLGGYVKVTYTGLALSGLPLDGYVGAAGGDGACGGTGTGGAGGVGGNGDANGGAGGAGAGPDVAHDYGGGGGGGGETDVRFGGTALANRVVIAGGGGGVGGSGGAGGYGSGASGEGGGGSAGTTALGGDGATTSGPGSGGSGHAGGQAGNAAAGGAGGSGTDTVNGAGGGGGGGGGRFGAGGGGAGESDGGGGGGGGSGGAFTLDGISPTNVTEEAGDAAPAPPSGTGSNGAIVFSFGQPPHTSNAANVTATSATLLGQDFNQDMYHFEYGTTTSYGTSTPSAAANAGDGATYTADISGLTPATTYHYRIDSSAAGPNAESQGGDITFTTLSLPVTGGTTAITGTSATMQGTDPNPGESYHFEYGKTTSYGSSTASATNNGGTLSATASGLAGGTTYHYRIVSPAGAGADATFKTLSLPVTLPASSVTASSAVLTGIDSNSATTYHFEYGKTTAYGSTTASAASNGTLNNVTTAISGLAAGTTYHYRIVDSASGPGLDSTFTTAGGGGGGGSSVPRDLVLTIHGPATGSIGKPLDYVATIANKGTDTVTGTKLKLLFHGGTVKLLSAPGCKGTTKLTCSIARIAADRAVRVKIAVRLSKAGTLTLAGSLVTTFKDPTPKNDKATAHTKVK